MKELRHRDGCRSHGATRAGWRPESCVVVVLLLQLALAACARSSGDGITLKMWAIGREAEVVPAILADFERSHPGVHSA